MAERTCENPDPRIRRTRQLLQQALEKLLTEKDFDRISVLDLAQAAGLNRATFYDHYVDKYALLESLVNCRFHQLLAEREVQFDHACSSALRRIVLAVCEFLTRTQNSNRNRQPEPHMEAAIIAALRGMILEGARRHASGAIPPELMASAASWAIYGSAREWVQTPGRCDPEEFADTVVTLVAPILQLAATA